MIPGVAEYKLTVKTAGFLRDVTTSILCLWCLIRFSRRWYNHDMPFNPVKPWVCQREEVTTCTLSSWTFPVHFRVFFDWETIALPVRGSRIDIANVYDFPSSAFLHLFQIKSSHSAESIRPTLNFHRISFFCFFIPLYTLPCEASAYIVTRWMPSCKGKIQTAINGTCNGIGISEGPISRRTDLLQSSVPYKFETTFGSCWLQCFDDDRCIDHYCNIRNMAKVISNTFGLQNVSRSSSQSP